MEEKHDQDGPPPLGVMRDRLEIVYRDEKLVVVNKPADLKINSDDSEDVTVATKLVDLCPGLADFKVKHSFRFVHRLDYATSGCLCLALNRASAKEASEAFRKRLVQKQYIALVRGHVKVESTVIEAAIGEDSSSSDARRMCTEQSPSCVKPRQAKTYLKLLQTGSYDGQPASKVLLVPQTGRRHQLRVHMCHAGHPIVGDYTYSEGKDSDPFRMMLHAWRLNIPGMLSVSTRDPFEVVEKWKAERSFASLDEIDSEWQNP